MRSGTSRSKAVEKMGDVIPIRVHRLDQVDFPLPGPFLDGLLTGKAGFAALVDEAASGEFITITRHGKPAAVLVSVEAAEAAKKALKKPQANFGELLMAFPGGTELERNPSRMRDVDL